MSPSTLGSTVRAKSLVCTSQVMNLLETLTTYLKSVKQVVLVYGTIHLRRQHVLWGEGCPHVPMVQRSQYIRIKNPLHKHFAGMPMV